MRGEKIGGMVAKDEGRDEREEREKWDEWDFGEEIDWEMEDAGTETGETTWDDVAKMAGGFGENGENEGEAWQLPEKPAREAERIDEAGEIVDLSEVMEDLRDKRYELLGHGTVSAELAEKIMNEGVEVGGLGRDTDTDSNFVYLKHNYGDLKETLDHWRHNEAREIVLMRVPVKYKLPFGSHQKDTYGVFYHDEEEHGNYGGSRGKYEGDYIYGWYDAGSGKVHKNANYHGDLDNEDDAEYMEKAYQGIKQSYLEQLPEDERAGWEAYTKMYYDYEPE